VASHELKSCCDIIVLRVASVKLLLLCARQGVYALSAYLVRKYLAALTRFSSAALVSFHWRVLRPQSGLIQSWSGRRYLSHMLAEFPTS
jgi:hypothetical protein